MKRWFRFLTAAVLLLVVCQPLTLAQSIQDETEIRKILQQRIEGDKKGVGLAVGMIYDKGKKVVAYGKIKNGEARDVDADSLFEIGSITKVFTTILHYTPNRRRNSF